MAPSFAEDVPSSLVPSPAPPGSRAAHLGRLRRALARAAPGHRAGVRLRPDGEMQAELQLAPAGDMVLLWRGDALVCQSEILLTRSSVVILEKLADELGLEIQEEVREGSRLAAGAILAGPEPLQRAPAQDPALTAPLPQVSSGPRLQVRGQPDEPRDPAVRDEPQPGPFWIVASDPTIAAEFHRTFGAGAEAKLPARYGVLARDPAKKVALLSVAILKALRDGRASGFAVVLGDRDTLSPELCAAWLDLEVRARELGAVTAYVKDRDGTYCDIAEAFPDEIGPDSSALPQKNSDPGESALVVEAESDDGVFDPWSEIEAGLRPP